MLISSYILIETPRMFDQLFGHPVAQPTWHKTLIIISPIYHILSYEKTLKNSFRFIARSFTY